MWLTPPEIWHFCMNPAHRAKEHGCEGKTHRPLRAQIRVASYCGSLRELRNTECEGCPRHKRGRCPVPRGMKWNPRAPDVTTAGNAECAPAHEAAVSASSSAHRFLLQKRIKQSLHFTHLGAPESIGSYKHVRLQRDTVASSSYPSHSQQFSGTLAAVQWAPGGGKRRRKAPRRCTRAQRSRSQSIESTRVHQYVVPIHENLASEAPQSTSALFCEMHWASAWGSYSAIR